MKDIQFVDGATDAAQLRFAIVVSVYHRAITKALCDGAVEALRQAGAVPNEKFDLLIFPYNFKVSSVLILSFENFP